MRKPLLGAFLGFLVGSSLGSLLVFGIYQIEVNSEPKPGWTTYPMLGDAIGPNLRQYPVRSPALGYVMFQAILFGGGLGSVVGAVSAASGAILRATVPTKSG